MTSPDSTKDADRTPEGSGDPANRGRTPASNDKNMARTGELSLEQVKKWLATRRTESRANRRSDEDRGASA